MSRKVLTKIEIKGSNRLFIVQSKENMIIGSLFFLMMRAYKCNLCRAILMFSRMSWVHLAVGWHQRCVVLSLTVSFRHACGQAETGNSLCAGVMEMAVWNNQMKRFLLHLLHPPARSGHPSWAKTNLNNFFSLFVTCSLHFSFPILSSPLMPSAV